MLTRLGLALMWLLHFLPPSVLAVFGEALGSFLYVFARERRQVATTNLRLCFPELPEYEIVNLVQRHFLSFGRSFLERGILWWGSQARIMRLVRVEGIEHLQARTGQPLILLTPHFVGLDMGWARLVCEHTLASTYSHQKNPVFDALLLKGRSRFGKPQLFSRQEGMRPAIKAITEGVPFYYLPDMDFGARDSIFVPFFGVPAATITGLSRLARLTGAAVMPCVTRQLADGYAVKFYPAWDNFPGISVAEDTRRMNLFIEDRVREIPEQYFWLHKRFKTRPPGEPKVY